MDNIGNIFVIYDYMYQAEAINAYHPDIVCPYSTILKF